MEKIKIDKKAQEEMTELKTLKDMPRLLGHPKLYDPIDANDLKEEAIKDIKNRIKKHYETHRIEINPISYQEGTKWEDYDEVINYIKWKNNLTKEDLK